MKGNMSAIPLNLFVEPRRLPLINPLLRQNSSAKVPNLHLVLVLEAVRESKGVRDRETALTKARHLKQTRVLN